MSVHGRANSQPTASLRVSQRTDPGERRSRVRSLRVVLVAQLEERLASEDELAVLNALAAGTMLTTLGTSDVYCALVSYRQERGGGGDFDAFTLDGAALRGLVSAAHSLNVDALWLDVRRPRTERGTFSYHCTPFAICADADPRCTRRGATTRSRRPTSTTTSARP